MSGSRPSGMLFLPSQIQIATDQATGCTARLAGIDIPKFDHTDNTFEELQVRIARIGLSTT